MAAEIITSIPMTGRESAATERALERIRTGECKTAYAAAKAEGIALSTIYRALDREKNADVKRILEERRRNAAT